MSAWNVTLLLEDGDPPQAAGNVTTQASEWRMGHLLLLMLIVMVIAGNAMVLFAVMIDRKLRTVTTNKFIASLAVSDLLVGCVVMPLSLHSKVHSDIWTLGEGWCQFHLVTGVFSTTASIVHLVAISLDRYFAIMFPTEYQRHSLSTSAIPYAVMIWLMALAISATLFMEPQGRQGVCWIENPQYLVLSSFLSFFLPGAIVVYMYVKIFRKLRNHQLYMFTQTHRPTDKRRSLPRVIIEEVRSRRGSRLSQSGSCNGSPTRRSSKERSPSQPEIHSIAITQQRWRSPTICAETFAHDRTAAAKKRVSIVPDPPSMDVSTTGPMNIAQIRVECEQARLREEETRSRVLSSDMSVQQHISAEDAVRKLSEERHIRSRERRRSSDLGRPNGVPIMVAFHKAYNDVKLGRRRSSMIEEDFGHISLKPMLSSMDEGGEEKEEEKEQEEQGDEDATKTTPLLLKEESKDTILSDGSQKPLLSLLEPPCNTVKAYKEPPRLSSLSLMPPASFLMVPAAMSINTPPLSPSGMCSLQVPRLFDCPSPTAPSNSSHSSYTSASGSSDTFRRISMNSYGSSLTDATDSTFEIDSRRSSAWSTIRSAVLDKRKAPEISLEGHKKSMSRGKLRRIATQVTRAIRRKRRESLAIRRESRATRVVAAILVAFLICWLPYFCVSVYRGIITGLKLDITIGVHIQLYVLTSWLGYAHSCFNPVIYMCLNKNFRATMKAIIQKRRREHR